jgi:hypothetical protein
MEEQRLTIRLKSTPSIEHASQTSLVGRPDFRKKIDSGSAR